MEKAVTERMDSFYHHYPAVATIVTSHAGGRDNAMAVAWHCALSRQPPVYMVAISPKRFSHGLIVESGEFAVNFIPYASAKLVALVGGCSGRDVDKLKAFGLACVPSHKVKAPVLEAAYAAYECRVVGRHATGDHDAFFGEIVAVHHRPAAYGSGRVMDLEQMQPILYLGDDLYTVVSTEAPVCLERQSLVRGALGR